MFQVDAIGTGGGHGAQGGSVSGEDGGIAYDTTQLPYQQGSGGASSASGTGGAGGGYLKISIFETLTVEGNYYFSLCVRKTTICVRTRSDTNRSVQSQKMVRGWKFWI